MRTIWGIPICPVWILTGHRWGPGGHPIVPLGKTGACTPGRPVQWARCPWTTWPRALLLSARRNTATWNTQRVETAVAACLHQPADHCSPSTPAPPTPVLTEAATAPMRGCARPCRWLVSNRFQCSQTFPSFASHLLLLAFWPSYSSGFSPDSLAKETIECLAAQGPSPLETSFACASDQKQSMVLGTKPTVGDFFTIFWSVKGATGRTMGMLIHKGQDPTLQLPRWENRCTGKISGWMRRGQPRVPVLNHCCLPVPFQTLPHLGRSASPSKLVVLNLGSCCLVGNRPSSLATKVPVAKQPGHPGLSRKLQLLSPKLTEASWIQTQCLLTTSLPPMEA